MGQARAELTARRFCLLLGVFCAGALAVGAACVFFGPVEVSFQRVLAILSGGRSANSVEIDIVLNQRLPRVILASMAGGGLAVAGAVFQALLRNPLATPHTLGVSAGGAVGAVVAISLGTTHVRLGAVSSVQLFALVGSFAVVALIYLLARRREQFSTLKLLLAGVTVALICSAAIMFIRYLSDPNKLVILDRWLMGGLETIGFNSVAAVIPLFLPALVVLLCQASSLNQLSFGEELAAGRGIDVARVQAVSFLGASVLTASVVSVAGPIGFVGLIVPHVLRLILGPDHRVLLFAAFFGGGAFLAVADTFARTVIAPSELPVGVLTALMGGPFFLLLLIRKAKM